MSKRLRVREAPADGRRQLVEHPPRATQSPTTTPPVMCTDNTPTSPLPQRLDPRVGSADTTITMVGHCDAVGGEVGIAALSELDIGIAGKDAEVRLGWPPHRPCATSSVRVPSAATERRGADPEQPACRPPGN